MLAYMRTQCLLKVIQYQYLQQVDKNNMFKPTLKRSRLAQAPKYGPRMGILSQGLSHKDKLQLTQKLQKPDIYIPSLLNKKPQKQQASKGTRIISPLNAWNLPYPQQVKQKLNLPIDQVANRLIGTKYGIYWLITQNQLYIWRYNSMTHPTTLTLQRHFQFEKDIRTVCLGHVDKDKCPLFNLTENCVILAIGFVHVIDLYTVDFVSLDIKPIDVRLKVDHRQGLDLMEIMDNQLLYTGDQGYLTRVAFNSITKYNIPTITKSTGKPSIFPSNLLHLFPTRTNTRLFTQQILRTQTKIFLLIRKQSQKSFLHKMGSSIMKFLSGRLRYSENRLIVEKEIHVYRVGNAGQVGFVGVLDGAEVGRRVRDGYKANQRIGKVMEANRQSQEGDQDRTGSIVSLFPIKPVNDQLLLTKNVNNRVGIATSLGLYLVMKQNIGQSDSKYYISFQQAPKTLPEQLFSPNIKQKCQALLLRGTLQTPQHLRSGTTVLPNPNAVNTSNPNPNPNTPQLLQPLVPKSLTRLSQSFGYNSLNILDNNLCFYFDEEHIQICMLSKNYGYVVGTVMGDFGGQGTGMDNTGEEGSEVKAWVLFAKNGVTVMRKCEIWEYVLAYLDTFIYHENEAKGNKDKHEQVQYLSHTGIYQIGKIIGFDRLCEQLIKLILKLNLNRPKGGTSIPIQFPLNRKHLSLSRQQHSQTIKQKSGNRLKYQLHANYNNQAYNSNVGQNNMFFYRWLMVKENDVGLEKVAVGAHLQRMIWRYFVLYALEKGDLRVGKAGIPGSDAHYIDYMQINPNLTNNPIDQLGVYAKFIFLGFKKYYEQIKHMKMQQIRRSPRKVQKIKNSLVALLALLKQKQSNQIRLLQTFIYTRPPSYQHSKKLTQVTLDTSNTLNPMTNPADAQYSASMDRRKPKPANKNTNQRDNKYPEDNQSQFEKSWIQKEYGSEPFGMLGFGKGIESGTGEVEAELKRIIPKLVDIIEVYQLLAANSQRQYQNLPTIHKFIQSYPYKKQVKQALLDLFSASNLAQNEMINKINKQLPELRLEADIYLAKWIRFIYANETYSGEGTWGRSLQFDQRVPGPLTAASTGKVEDKGIIRKGTIIRGLSRQTIRSQLTTEIQQSQPQPQQQITAPRSRFNPFSFFFRSPSPRPQLRRPKTPSSVLQQIQISDLQKLVQKLQFEQLIKIRHLFEEIPDIYLTILIKELEYRKLQYGVVKDVVAGKEGTRGGDYQDGGQEYGAGQPKLSESYSTVLVKNGLFNQDKYKANVQWREWLHSQILSLRNQIQAYLQYLANSLNNSAPKDYLQAQKNFDKCTRLVQTQCRQSTQLLTNLINYLNQQKILSQKVYRLTISIDPSTRSRSLITNLLQKQKQTRPELLSSRELMSNMLRKGRDELFMDMGAQQKEDGKGQASKVGDLKNGRSLATGLTLYSLNAGRNQY